MYFPEFVEMSSLFWSCHLRKQASRTAIFTRQSTSFSTHLNLKFGRKSSFFKKKKKTPATQICALSHALLSNLKGYNLGDNGTALHCY